MMTNPMSQSAASPPLSSVVPSREDNKAREAAHQFEAVFVGQMAKLMMESVEQDQSFSGGHGEDMFRGVLAETMGTEIAKGRGIGLADKVMAEIIRLQKGGNR